MVHIEPGQADMVAAIADDLRDMARSAAASDADPFQLRQILRFVGQVVQVVDETFESVYGLLIDIAYLSEKDVREERHLVLQKELDLLLAKSHFRDSTEICSRLRHLREMYDLSIAGIINARGLDATAWGSVFSLINEYEGSIINTVVGTIGELHTLLSGNPTAALPEIRTLAAERARTLRYSLDGLRDLRARIFGLSGHEGLLELAATRRDAIGAIILDQRFGDNRRGAFMGDVFSNIQNATIVNRSNLQNALNKVQAREGEEIADFLKRVADAVEQSGNQEAADLLDQLNEEIAKPKPRPSLLRRSWSQLVEILPDLAKVAGAGMAIAKLFG